MKIQVVLKNGQMQYVREEDTLQLMITTGKVHSFKRADGWVVVSRDKIRRRFSSYQGKNRRKNSVFGMVCWNWPEETRSGQEWGGDTCFASAGNGELPLLS